jgi:hypothetical protein
MGTKPVHPSSPILSLQFLACVLTVGLLTGCVEIRFGDLPPKVPKVTTVEVPLAPNVNQPLKEPVKASLEVAAVHDARNSRDPWTLVYNWDNNRAFVAEKPVAEIFQDGLSNALRQNGFMSTNRPRYVLQTELRGFFSTSSDEVPPASVQVLGALLGTDLSNYQLMLRVDFTLFNPEAKRPVWSLNQLPELELTCCGKRLAWTYSWPETCGKGFAEMAEDAIHQLIANQQFRNLFETQATNAP